jgi:hypothetical protein
MAVPPDRSCSRCHRIDDEANLLLADFACAGIVIKKMAVRLMRTILAKPDGLHRRRFSGTNDESIHVIYPHGVVVSLRF